MASTTKPLADAIRQRRATPSFDGEPIPPGDLHQILEAGLNAPSGYNMQPWRFIVVQHPEQRKRLRAASYNQAKVEEASAVIVACGDMEKGMSAFAESLNEHLLEKGVKTNLVVLHGADHKDTVLAMGTEGSPLSDAVLQMIERPISP